MTSLPFPIQQVRNVEAILSDAFRFLHIHGKPLGKSLLKIASPVFIVEGIFTLVLSGSPAADALTTLNMFRMFFAVVVAALAQTTVACYCVLYVDDPLRPTSVSELWHNVKQFIGRTFIAFVLYGTLSAVGFLFFVFPGVYLSIAGVLAAIVIVQEDRSPSMAISRSMTLVQGYWWPTLGIVLLSAFLQLVLNTIGEAPNTLIFSSYTALLNSSLFLSVLMVFTNLFASIVSLVGVLVLSLLLTFQYYNLVERKEAQGLLHRLAAMENAADKNSAVEDTPTQE